MVSFSEVSLKFTSLLENKEATVNETVDFGCEMNKIGVEVTWLKNSHPLSLTDGRYQIVNTDCAHHLIIPSVTPDDTGEYTVKVEDLQSTAFLTVIGQYCSLELAICADKLVNSRDLGTFVQTAPCSSSMLTVKTEHTFFQTMLRKLMTCNQLQRKL